MCVRILASKKGRPLAARIAITLLFEIVERM